MKRLRIALAPELADDIERILVPFTQHDIQDVQSRMSEIIEAISVLEHNPLIGRPIDDDKRELVIGRLLHGYVALYRYIEGVETVFVLALRSQREAGYR